MTKFSTKRSLVTSVIALMLCFSMLIGTTFAWFTDSVTSANNIIKSGNLDVEMYWADGTEAVPAVDSTDWKDASKGAIFNNDLWEPGYAEVRHIKIANEGTLALKYQLAIVANGEVSKLADVIDVYFLDPAKQVEERTDLNGVTPVGTLKDVLAGMPANASGELLAKTDAKITLALKMRESADNQYQDLAIGSDFAVQLVATQLTNEEDSFNNQYDKDAEYPPIEWDGSVDTSWFDPSQAEFTISNGEQLAGLAKLGNQLGGKTVTLDADIDLGGKNWTPIRIFNSEKSFTFDGANHTIFNLNIDSGAGDNGLFDNSVATIKNLNISDAQVKSNGRSGIIAGRHYGDIINCHVKNSTIEDNFWAVGGIVGLYNSGNIKNCSITNVDVKSNGGVGGIVGVLNETAGTRNIENCSVIGGTVENTGAYGDAYTGAGIVGMININNVTVNIKGCNSTATLKGNYIHEICPPADAGITLNIN